MNVYQPWRVRVEERIDETPDTRTLRLRFLDEEVARDFHFRAGQFGEYSVFGEGECTFCIASSPTRKGYIELLPDDYLATVIREGGLAVGKSSYMPAWGGTIAEEDIANIVAHIRRLGAR